MTTMSQTVNSSIRSWLRHRLSGALRPNAFRRECIRHPEARMGNQMENTRLNHSSCRLGLAETYSRYERTTFSTSAGNRGSSTEVM